MGGNYRKKKRNRFLAGYRWFLWHAAVPLFIVVATLSIATLKKHCTYYAIVEKS